MEVVFQGQDLSSETADSSVASRSGIIPVTLGFPPDGGPGAPGNLLPAVGYVRVSTEDQAKEGFSSDAQRGRIRAYCVAKGYRLLREFVDDGFSGRSTNRPGFQRLMAAVRDGLLVDRLQVRIEAVVVAKFDRLNRNLFEFLATQQEMQGHGVHFASVDETIDTTGPFGRFSVQIIGAFAELESGIIGERVRHGMHQKALAGGFNGMSPPYGYEVNDSRLVINQSEAVVVRRIDRWRHRGKSYRWIADRLNATRIPTKRGKAWTARQVFRIDHSPLYRGALHWQEIVTPGTHEPIITRPRHAARRLA